MSVLSLMEYCPCPHIHLPLEKSIDRGCILEDARAVSLFPPANRHLINIKIPASGIVINEKGNIPQARAVEFDF
jgi:hypothetical protein